MTPSELTWLAQELEHADGETMANQELMNKAAAALRHCADLADDCNWSERELLELLRIVAPSVAQDNALENADKFMDAIRLRGIHLMLEGDEANKRYTKLLAKHESDSASREAK